MNTTNHRFRSAKADGPDATQVQPSGWNDGHIYTGGVNGQTLVRDTSDVIFGATWADHGGITAYTPVWSATGAAPSLGNSSLVGAYSIVSQTVFVNVRFIVGSTAGLGSGVWAFTLPPLGQPSGFVLTAELFNSVVGSYPGIAIAFGTGQFIIYAAGAPNGVGASLPFTFKANDQINVTGVLFYPG